MIFLELPLLNKCSCCDMVTEDRGLWLASREYGGLEARQHGNATPYLFVGEVPKVLKIRKWQRVERTSAQPVERHWKLVHIEGELKTRSKS